MERTDPSANRSFRANARFYVPGDVMSLLHAIAAERAVATVVDVDALQRSALARVDRVMLLALDALSYAGVRVVLVSRLEAECAELVHRGVPRSLLFDRRSGWREDGRSEKRHAPSASSCPVTSVRKRMSGIRLIGISDDQEILDMLDDHDRGIALGTKHDIARTNIAVSGDLSVRAAIWWLVDVRWKTGMATFT